MTLAASWVGVGPSSVGAVEVDTVSSPDTRVRLRSAVIAAMPSPTTVTEPSGLTVATFRLEEKKVKYPGPAPTSISIPSTSKVTARSERSVEEPTSIVSVCDGMTGRGSATTPDDSKRMSSNQMS